jgi:tRNA A-37 threonylcarbamoyl transferase component Bud32
VTTPSSIGGTPPKPQASSAVVSEFPHCPVCQAPASLRAVTCAVCDAPLPPSKAVTSPGDVRSGEWVRFRRPPEELKDLYADVVKALLPNIRLLGMAGEGGMALVFVGRDSALKREVAVKLLSPTLADDEVARKRFTREAEAIAAVTHPNIVNVYQVGEIAERGIPYFVMQFVDGPTLGMGSLRGRMLTEARVRRLMSDVAAGLAAAHRRKVYHRDIKPGNIVLDGESGRAMVLDFGISAAYSARRHSLGRRLTEEGMYVGTPTYMSPEQASGEDVTGESDVYSLGVVAFELLIGRPPFEGTPVGVTASHLHEVPPRVDQLRSDVSEELATLIARCLEKEPARRPSAEDVVQFLSPETQATIEWPPPGLYRLRSDGARATSALAAASVGAGLLFASLAIWPEMAVLRRPGLEPDLLRSFVLGGSVAIVFGLVAVAAFYSVVIARRWRWAASSGYPRWVIADVASDVARDAGALINGTADFAFVSGATRHTLLALRRARSAVVAAAAVVGFAGVLRWLTAWLASGGMDPRADIAVHWASAVLVTYVVFFACGLYEARIHRRERGKTGTPSNTNVPPLRSELVTMWLAGAEKARRSLGGR